MPNTCTRPLAAQRQPDAARSPRPRTGPALVHTTLGSTPKMPSRLTLSRRDEPVREQVQAQVGVRDVGRRERRGRSRSARRRGGRRGRCVSVGAGQRRPARAARAGRPGTPSAGAGYQVSRTCRPRRRRRRSWPGRSPRRCASRVTQPSAAPVAVASQRARCSDVLDLSRDAVALTAALVDVASVSGDEAAAGRPGRGGAAPPARSWRSSATATSCWPAPTLGRAQRVVLAGHLDTVPIAGNLPSRARRATCCTAAARRT